MAWDDKPTRAQLSYIRQWGNWVIPSQELSDALAYLENNCTRKQVSTEMGRIRLLHGSRKLTKQNFYDADIWKNFKPKPFDWREFKCLVHKNRIEAEKRDKA